MVTVTTVTIMRFYNRETELALLADIHAQTSHAGQMVVITGRRRIGKTSLALEFVEGKRYLYLFIAKKTESLLCQEFLEEIKETFDITIPGEFHTFKDVFQLLLNIAKETPFILVIDEFQEFYNINSSVFSDIQKLWDLNKSKVKLQAILMGSVYSLMHKIFEGAKEPLFARATHFIHLKPFTPKEIYNILQHNKKSDVNTLFDYYMFTGGVPKYIEILIQKRKFSRKEIIDLILSAHSPFLDEGKNVLIEEFGKEYGAYFSILELIAAGKTARGEIESILQYDIGGYLERLTSDYSVIKKIKPINAKPNSRIQKYAIKDHFLNFWFRFIYKNLTAAESGNFEYIKNILKRDFSTYEGRQLESFFYDVFLETRQFNIQGSYWDKNGLNEIDFVGVNDLEKKILLAEIKMNKKKIDMNCLKEKSVKLLRSYPNYQVSYQGLSLEDIVALIKG